MNRALYLFSFLLCLNCLEHACGVGDAIANFDRQYVVDGEIPYNVCRDAAREIVAGIKATAEYVPQHVFDYEDEVDLYIDDSTVQQSNLLTLLEKLRCVEERMPDGRGKDKIRAIIDRYDASGVDSPGDFVDLCRNAEAEIGNRPVEE
jgi:hypothetical protein